MATQHAAPPKGAKKHKTAAKSKPTREPRSAISELDVDERRAFDEWKRKKERDQEAWEHKTSEELELEFLEKLNDKDKQGHTKGKLGGHGGPCPDPKPKIDLDALAEKVFQRLMVEARVERERTGLAG